MKTLPPNITIKELLYKYPSGFSVSPFGKIRPTIYAASTLITLEAYVKPPTNGGYIAFDSAQERLHDEDFEWLLSYLDQENHAS